VESIPSHSARDYLERLRTDRRVAQAWETLGSSLALVGSDKLLRTLLVCSTQPQEGKTTVATHLEMVAALAGERVLLVDADLRRPRLHTLFEIPIEGGFADLLEGRAVLADVARPFDLGAGARGALRVVPSGAGSAASVPLLASAKLADVVAALGANVDKVILDSPPALSVSDALFLAPAVDGVVFVVGAGAVAEREAVLAKQRLANSGARLLGFVMNRFDDAEHGPGYHPYHAYYET
jgi:capsular exopolysaccharide synthesis family protein